MGPRSFEGLMTLSEGGRTVFGVKTAIRRLVPGESTNCFPKRKTTIHRLCGELNIPETDKLSFLGERLPFVDCMGNKLSSYWERLPFANFVGESELSSG